MLRRGLPRAFRKDGAVGYDLSSLSDVIGECKTILLSELQRSDLAQRFNRHCVAHDKARTPYNLPFPALAEPFLDGKETIFYRPASQRALIETEGSQEIVKIYVWEKQVVLRGPVLSLIENIFSHEEFTGVGSSYGTGA